MPDNHIDVLAIIPARGGSTRIKDKNIIDVAGKPLMVYTIEAAKQCNMINDVVVSTDDEHIAQVSIAYGASVIRRPTNMSQDDSPTEDAIRHVIETMESRDMSIDAIVILQPTSPMRTVDHIYEGLYVARNACADSVFSVCEVQNPHLMGHFNEHGIYVMHYGKRLFTQDVMPYYTENGAFYYVTRDAFMRYGDRICGNTHVFVMDVVSSIDVDTIYDLEIIRNLKEHGI